MKNLNPWALMVVDDDPLIHSAVGLSLPDNWISVSAKNRQEALSARNYHVALVDVHLSGDLENRDGITLVEEIRKKEPHVEIISMSGDVSRKNMEDCLRAGASRFLAKPISEPELKLVLEKIETWLLLQQATFRSQHAEAVTWIGRSGPSQKIQRLIAELSHEGGPILVEGETGTGKEVACQLLHRHGARSHIVTVNIAAIPENLFESELFGHVKGAFTGADQNRMGVAEAAHGGDLFLDEIEALPLNQQVKLLRFLETGEVRRIGSKDCIQVQTRVIAATNRNLESLVKEGQFREDLFWRLSGHRIELPPLRSRLEDIADLCKYFFSKDPARKKVLSEDASQFLTEYHWPGNVRELKLLCTQLIRSAPLPIVRHEDIRALMRPVSQPHGGPNLDYSRGLTNLLADFESYAIKQALEKFEDIDEAARVLQISRSSIYKKIKDYSIPWGEH